MRFAFANAINVDAQYMFASIAYQLDANGNPQLFICNGDPYFSIGQPDAASNFSTFQQDASFYSSRFDYFQIKKVELDVMSHSSVSTAGNIDSGQIYLFPWGGNPRVCNLANGASTITYQDVERLQKHKVFQASSRHSGGQDRHGMTLKGYCLDKVVQNLPPVDVMPKGQLGRTIASPMVRTDDMTSNSARFGAYLPGFYWYHPLIKAANTAVYVLTISVKVLVEWSGLGRSIGANSCTPTTGGFFYSSGLTGLGHPLTGQGFCSNATDMTDHVSEFIGATGDSFGYDPGFY